MNLTSDTSLAEQFGISVEKLHELRKRHNWPCVRFGRFEVRFTDAQVEHIVSLHSVAPKKKAAAPVAVAGQTARSASRSRAS